MNWTKAVLAGVASGIVLFVVDFILHGLILGQTYTEYPVFSQVFSPGGSGFWWFPLISICIGIAAALLFAKSRGSWAEGIKGGGTYGFFLGLVAFFGQFYNPLIFEGFPYFLSWCWGASNLIDGVIGGIVLGAIYRTA